VARMASIVMGGLVAVPLFLLVANFVGLVGRR
jgi:hypothetical protein